MRNNKESSEKYITLKEASKLTGYSPDYLGQLIRKGKLVGKQVYLNVAWMTTEKAIEEYLEANKVLGGGKSSFKKNIHGHIRRLAVQYGSGDRVIRLARYMLYFFIFLLLILSIFLAYALFANISRVLGK